MPEKCCDLVFTSPPFWRKELYKVGDEDAQQKQASHKFRSWQEFEGGFLKSLVQESTRVLREGGVLALHIPADGQFEKAVQQLAEQQGLERLCVVGTRSQNDPRVLRPVFLWRRRVP